MISVTTSLDYMPDALNIDFCNREINKIPFNFTMHTQDMAHIAFFSYVFAFANGYKIVNVLKNDASTECVAYYIQFKELNAEELGFWSRALGVVLGGALGDALGYRVEFMTEAEIQHRFGVFQDFCESCSDDTQMTIFSMYALLNEKNFYMAYLQWFKTEEGQPNVFSESSPALQHRRAPGNTCMSALHELELSPQHRAAKNESKGCGSIMRVAPLGVFASSRDEAFLDGYISAKVTHGHVDSALSAAIFAAVIYEVVQGKDLFSLLDDIDSIVPQQYTNEFVRSNTKRLLDKLKTLLPALTEKPTFTTDYYKSNFIRALHDLGEGWVADEALVIGLLAYLKSWDFRSALILAANHDGDSDSTAILAGSLYGAKNGLSGVDLSGICLADLSEEVIYMVFRLFVCEKVIPTAE